MKTPQAIQSSGELVVEQTNNLDLLAVIQNLPKVDLHRHLEGSLRFTTIVELVQELNLDLPRTPEELNKLVQIRPGDPRTPKHFLSKFKTLRQLYRKPSILERITLEAIEDAAEDGICYLELRFTPIALTNSGDILLSEAFSSVIEAVEQATKRFDISVGLIASLNRHESLESAERVAQLAIDNLEKGVVGLGLAGEEWSTPTSAFASIFTKAKQAGLGITIHAGEWGKPISIREAIEILGATRIGHGIRVLEEPELVRDVRERNTVLEVCLTSNEQSGAVPSLHAHPLPSMIDAGLQVTLNSDDPGISNIRLSDEYQKAIEAFDLSLITLKGLILAGAQAAFLSKPLKTRLEAALMESLF
jgi:adenosine deaminase